MSLTDSCPNPALLKQMLDGELPAEEQAALTVHLDQCKSCQETVESLVAGKESWADVAECLAKPASAADPALAEVLHEARQDAGRTMTLATNGATGEISLEFLASSDKPGSIGRLDHYEITQVVGRGGNGVVMKAFDEELHRVVAIKVLAPQLATSATARKRFKRESKASAGVSHDHVVGIHQVSESNGLPYLVMQFVAGQSVQEKIEKTGPLELQEILRIGQQAASGLAAAHAQGLVHRDVKPANILLENGIERVKITDFGLARAADDASLTQTGVVAGTPQYMAPEQASGSAVDHRADLFSLGSVMYAMCTGHPPFRATTTMAVLKRVCDDTPRNIREINPDMPQWLCDIIAKLHAKNPAERYQTAREVAELLERCLAHVQQPDAKSLPTIAVPPRPALEKPQVSREEPLHIGWLITAWVTGILGILILKFANSVSWLGIILCVFGGSLLFQSAVRRIRGILAGASAHSAQTAELRPAREPTESKGAWIIRLALGLMAVGGIFQLIVLIHSMTRGKGYMLAMGSVIVGFALLAGFFLYHFVQQRKHRLQSVRVRRAFEICASVLVILGGLAAFEYMGLLDMTGTIRERLFDEPHKPEQGGDLYVEVSDDTIHVAVDKHTAKELHVDPAKTTFKWRLPAGMHMIRAYKRGKGHSSSYATSITLREGETKRLRAFDETGSLRISDAKDAESKIAGHAGHPGDWVQLFNNRDKAGWTGKHPDAWTVEDGVLIGRGKHGSAEGWSELIHARDNYKDFELRSEVKFRGTGWASLRVRKQKGSYHGYKIWLSDHPEKTGARTGRFDVDGGDANHKKVDGPAEILMLPDQWLNLEFSARGPELTLRLNGREVGRLSDPSFRQGELQLEVAGPDSEVQFRKIEIKELPEPRLPGSADQVLPALAGTWRGEFTQRIYGGKPAEKKFNAISVNDWIVEGKWLRQRVHMEDGGFLALSSFEPGSNSFRNWFFHARGLVFGPSAGRWDAGTRTATLTNLPDHRMVMVNTWRFVDADTGTWESVIRDKEGNTIFEIDARLRRTAETLTIDETTAAGPLPPEMAVLARLVGEWETSGIEKNSKSPAGRQANWRTSMRSILGGRVIATHRTGSTSDDDESYTISTFDTFSKAYMRWSFKPNGNVLEYGGLWDEATQTLKWHWAGKDGSQTSNTWNLRHPNRNDWQIVTNDALGKTRYEIQATSVRQSEMKELPTTTKSPAESAAAQADDLPRLQGRWIPVSGEITGKPLPSAQLKQVPVLVFAGGEWQQWQADVKNETRRGNFRLNAKATPKELDLVGWAGDKQTPVYGIYRIEGDRLILCLANAGKPRPTKFETHLLSENVILEFRREAAQAGQSNALLTELRRLITLHEKTLTDVRKHFEAGRVPKAELIAAEIELLETRLKLREAEGKRDDLIPLLQELIARHEELVKFAKELHAAGAASPTELNAAEKRLSEAKIRLLGAGGKPEAKPESKK